MIDFTELTGDVRGEALEKLVRLIGLNLKLDVEWSGRGSDQGRDLLLIENRSGPIGQSRFVWLVSCKDKAHSQKSVTEDDLPRTGVLDKLTQHNADGFLLVTTTTLSTGAKALLDSLNKNGQQRAKIWDSAELEQLLLRPENMELLKQFLPQSYLRVSQADSLEMAILQFRHQLPTHVLNEVLQLVKPFGVNQLRGEDLWPYDENDAKALDQIIDALLVERDVALATTYTQNIDFDALHPLLLCLQTDYSQQLYAYLEAVIFDHHDEDLIFNAFQFLLDHQELSLEQIIDLAQQIPDGDSIVRCQQVENYVVSTLCDYSGGHYVFTPFLERFSKYQSKPSGYTVYGTNIDSIGYGTNGDRMEFFGSFNTTLTCPEIPSLITPTLIRGRFDGYFTEWGIYLTNSSLGEERQEDKC